ncbi:DUF6090 family protein [Aestuariibaculum marinum]|uniref:Uncharacterized protein n=1 Tax=Aestuariibaculum marinum TaxID=2683592 RepID=A0A8J6PQV9_9FLAO|nr:DUF6090 family protein [Aestuariibaculum marinum]MBD0822712.1 hypothetical protein [Aestuariibaculum marinum]
MIKFFRKIRQRLVTENKFSKYLIYAIGEIILVVIGILIALQINNRNLNKSNLKESKEFVVRLKAEVKSNIGFVKEEIEKKESQRRSSLAILKMIGEDITKLSSKTLDSLIIITMANGNVEFKNGTLNEGLNTGKVALIKSDSLKTRLYGLPSLVEEVRSGEKYMNEDLNEYFYPFIYEHISFRQMDFEHTAHGELIGPSKFSSHNNLNVLNILKFESLIDNIFYNSNVQIDNYQRLKNELENLYELIEEYE